MARTILMVHPGTELYGSDRMFLESVEAMVQAGWRTVVSVPADGPLGAPLRAAGAELVCCPAPVLRKAALRPRGFVGLAATAGRSAHPAVRLLRSVRPDVLYVSTLSVPSWILLGRLTGNRVVAHAHEAEDALPMPLRVGLATPLLLAHAVIVNSRATARSLTAAVPRLASRMELVYNGVAGPDRPSTHAHPHHPARLLVVGRLSPRKGVDTAVAAAGVLRQRGRDVTLRFVGSVFSGYEWYEKDLRARISDLHLDDVIELAGFRADVWPEYAAADIALVPSFGESFGNASVEAQLAGTPLVVTDVQALPETVDYGRSGSIAPAGDADRLAAAIEELLDDWPATIARAARANRTARERFSPAGYRRQVAQVLAGQADTRAALAATGVKAS